jgi:hypothetical protein
MKRVGLGQMRLGPAAFYALQLSDFLLAAEGFFELEEMRERQSWERARWSAAMAIQPHAKKGARIKPSDLCKFPWDPKPKKQVNQMLHNMLKKNADESKARES